MPGPLRKSAFDLLELILVVGFVGFVAFRAGGTYYSPIDTARLSKQYGPQKYSHNVEEWVVRDFFQDRRDGVFVDIGSADARKGSNTYYLESALNWSGIAVDALEEHASSYREFRPRTRFFAYFVAERSGEPVTLYVPPTTTESSSYLRDFAALHATSPLAERTVGTITLDDLLSGAGVTRIDFLSMDIEMAEPRALAGFDVDRFRPSLVCIEAHLPVRQQILDYFAKHGYVLVGRYLWTDLVSLYLKPLDD